MSRVRPLLALTLAAVLLASGAGALAAGMGGMHMHMHMAPYPDVKHAGAKSRARAASLARRTLANASRFRTWARAERLGYVYDRHELSRGRPQLLHLRRNGARMSGRFLDPRGPQALVYWLPPKGRPTLVAFMYRARIHARVPTFGGIVHWHDHGGATKMMHVWLTHDLRSQYARCAPVNQLQRSRHIHYTRPRVHEIDADAPCPDWKPAGSGGGMHHHMK